MSLLSDFLRVGRTRRCPVCGKADWCMVAREAPDDPASAICARVESPRRWGTAGWFHRLRSGARTRWRPRVTLPIRRAADPQLANLARRAFHALGEQSRARLAVELGVSRSALDRLEVGLATGELLEACGIIRAHHAWTFPMRDERGQVIGIRLRLPAGNKLCVRGSREGLFLPSGLAVAGALLVVAEGATDAAALLGLGFEAVGRPTCTGGVRLIERLVVQQQPAQIVVMADMDTPGLEGAQVLARSLRTLCKDVRIAVPPAGHKDVREWVRAGATQNDVIALLAAAKPLELNVAVAKGGRGQ